MIYWGGYKKLLYTNQKKEYKDTKKDCNIMGIRPIKKMRKFLKVKYYNLKI